MNAILRWLFDIVARHGLHFDQSRQVGIVFHMISSLTEMGRVGMTATNDAIMRASSRSFLASVPLALANCRSLNGLIWRTDMPAASKARTTPRS